MTKVLCRKSEVSHQAYIQKCGCDDILVEWEFKLVEISTISFDTNSNHIGIDNHCLAHISHIQDDFKGELVQGSQPIEGLVVAEHLIYGWGQYNQKLRMMMAKGVACEFPNLTMYLEGNCTN